MPFSKNKLDEILQKTRAGEFDGKADAAPRIVSNGSDGVILSIPVNEGRDLVVVQRQSNGAWNRITRASVDPLSHFAAPGTIDSAVAVINNAIAAVQLQYPDDPLGRIEALIHQAWSNLYKTPQVITAQALQAEYTPVYRQG